MDKFERQHLESLVKQCPVLTTLTATVEFQSDEDGRLSVASWTEDDDNVTSDIRFAVSEVLDVLVQAKRQDLGIESPQGQLNCQRGQFSLNWHTQERA
jgi:hypothetical protein